MNRWVQLFCAQKPKGSIIRLVERWFHSGVWVAQEAELQLCSVQLWRQHGKDLLQNISSSLTALLSFRKTESVSCPLARAAVCAEVRQSRLSWVSSLCARVPLWCILNVLLFKHFLMTGELSQLLQVNLCVSSMWQKLLCCLFFIISDFNYWHAVCGLKLFAVLFLAYYCLCGCMLHIYNVTYIAGGKQADRVFSISLEY